MTCGLMFVFFIFVGCRPTAASGSPCCVRVVYEFVPWILMRLAVSASMVAFLFRSATTKAFIPSTRVCIRRNRSVMHAVRKYHSVAPIVRKAKIISLSNPDDDANSRLHHGTLPEGTSLLAIGTKLKEFDIEKLQKEQPNVIFVSHPKVW